MPAFWSNGLTSLERLFLSDKILKDAAGKYESEEEDEDIDDFMQYNDDFYFFLDNDL
jgi:hypothetical protein